VCQIPTESNQTIDVVEGSARRGDGRIGDDDPVSVDPSLADQVALALADLAERLGLDPGGDAVAAIEVLAAEVVTWPDSGLGCRNPGMRYPQVPVDGCRIVLRHADRRYSYHAGGRSAVPFLCERPG
jgi:hypothetical protein